MSVESLLRTAPLLLSRTPEEVREAVERVYEEGDFQRDLVEGTPDLGFLAWLFDLFPEVPEGGAAGVGDVVGWVAIAAGAATLGLLLVHLVSRIRLRRRRKKGGKASEASGAAGGDGEVDPEALARDGRFAEAVHALLLLAQRAVERRRGEPFPRALTSREILRRAKLPGGARDALSSLVLAVEVSLFGGADVGAPDYEACSDRFRSLESALGEEAA
jgi:hypothetical protein